MTALRPQLAVIAAALQSLMFAGAALAWIAWAGWGVFPYSLVLSSIFFGPFVLAFGISAFGLLRTTRWGWLLAIVSNGIFGLIAVATVHPTALGLIPWAAAGILLTSRFRRFYA